MLLAQMQMWEIPECECRMCPVGCSAEMSACSEWCCVQTQSQWIQNLWNRKQVTALVLLNPDYYCFSLSNKWRRASQIPGIIMKDPCGSIATKQALRMLGESAAEMPHILHISFSLLLRDWRFRRLSKQLQSEEIRTEVCLEEQCLVQKRHKCGASFMCVKCQVHKGTLKLFKLSSRNKHFRLLKKESFRASWRLSNY